MHLISSITYLLILQRTLHAAVSQIIRDPEAYDKIINRLWSGKKTQKDRYLVQLFNRAYLALHPSPKPEHLAKYMAPRYLTGTMMRDPKQFVDIDQKIKETQDLLQKAEHPQKDLDNLNALLKDMQAKRNLIP